MPSGSSSRARPGSRSPSSPGPPERMSVAAPARGATGAARSQPWLIALLCGLAAVGWWSTARRMSGMDEGPWTALGTLGWFLGVWVVMMAAMMLPSVAPTVGLYARMTAERGRLLSWVFTAGYLLTWSAAGALVFGIARAGDLLAGDALAWDRAGRWAAAVTLVVAAAYEVTPLKDVCLDRCRSPLGFLLGSWRDGFGGALGMGVRPGAWCLGCCWALMASLFALGVMSVVWMALVASLI